MKNALLARWQANFWAGLAIVLPGVISIVVLVWLFSTSANLTDWLLFFLPRRLTHRLNGEGTVYWYWSLVALLMAVALVCLVGQLARNYFGKRLIKWFDAALLRVPLLNKIYSATKQVNEAFSTGNKTAFRTVVLVEFPRPGVFSLGFITSEQAEAVQTQAGEKMVCVFVPTTPNPTAGFLLFVQEDKLTKLDMSASEGIKYLVSLGSIKPERQTGVVPETKPIPAGLVSAP